jgi:branched-chain amino acid transport system substrate-binding protein
MRDKGFATKFRPVAGVAGHIAFDSKGDIKNGALTRNTYKGDKREQMAVVR